MSSNESDSEHNHMSFDKHNKSMSFHHDDHAVNSSFLKYIPPPNPILPKSLYTDYEPPKCPLKKINFITLNKFLTNENT
jgi:hypothetical protein